nr:nitroreductase family deazaflavin-dependent oxidoreductase [Mycobacterium parascrofulaceum]
MAQFPRWYARWNRLVTNKIVRLWAGWVPAMGLLTHVGRKSGKRYRTPLNIFPTGEGLAVFLPYGPAHTEWLKNVTAAGSAEIQHYGKTITVTDPHVVTKADAQPLVVSRWRPIYARAPFAEVLLLKTGN